MKYIRNRTDMNKIVIPSDVLTLNDIFNRNGHKLYVVGGAIRDFIKGDKPKDYDLCTDAVPDRIMEILKDKYKFQLQGESFGVVVVYTDETPEGMEIATFREDITKGRNPEVRFGNVTIEQDVKRRDITFNGLFYDIESKEIIDLVGGKEDLLNKVVRMIGNPMERIAEDPLRIFRVFRFATRYGSIIDKVTKNAIHKHNDISSVSMERIWDTENGEFMKSFKQAKNFQQYLDLLSEFNLWDQILPDMHVNTKISNSDNIELVLAQMFLSESVENINNLPISSKILGKVTFLISLLNFSSDDLLGFYKTRKRTDTDNKTISTWLNLNNISGLARKFINFKPSINSSKVMSDFNLTPSKELGDKIKELEINKFLNS